MSHRDGEKNGNFTFLNSLCACNAHRIRMHISAYMFLINKGEKNQSLTFLNSLSARNAHRVSAASPSEFQLRARARCSEDKGTHRRVALSLQSDAVYA